MRLWDTKARNRVLRVGSKPTMRRILTTWLLLLALGLPLAQPVAGAWHCPDGTLCVAGADGRYQCAGGACRMACCATARAAGGAHCGTCRHGALPGACVATRGGNPCQRMADCACRFTATARVAAAVLDQSRRVILGDDLLVGVLPTLQALNRELQSAGCFPIPTASPPRSPCLPPPGSRAPPIV
jgi:hypothetical protein